MTEKAKKWSRIINAQEASGLSPKEYAQEHELNLRHLRDWRYRLGRSKGKKIPVTAIEFVEVAPLMPAKSAELYLVLNKIDVTVIVDEWTNMTLLKQTLEALC